MNLELRSKYVSLYPGTGPADIDMPAHPAGPIEKMHALSVLLRAVWEKKYWVLLASVFGLACGLGIAFVQKPVYEAKALMEVDAPNENYFNINVRDTGSTLSGASYGPETYLQTQARLLQTDELLLQVATILKLRDSSAYQYRPGLRAKVTQMLHGPVQHISTEDILLSSIRSHLTVRVPLQSRIVEILYRSTDAQLAAGFANVLVQEYVRDSIRQRLTTSRDTTEMLTRQLADLKGRLETASHGLQDYAKSSGLTLTGTHDKESLAEDGVRQLQAELMRAQADRVAKQSIYESARNSTEDSIPPTLDTGALREYEIMLSTLRRQLAEISTTLTPSHPKRQKLQAQIADIEATIFSERRRILNRLKEDYNSASERERMLEASFQHQAKAVTLEAPRLAQYNILKREVETTQALYDSLLQKAKEAGIMSALRASNVRLIGSARSGSIPVSPNYPLDCGIGFLGGLTLSIVIIVVRDAEDRMIRLPGDATRVTNAPELGAIPSAKAAVTQNVLQLLRKQASSGSDLISWKDGSSFLAESFRSALASLLFSRPQEDRNGSASTTALSDQRRESGNVIVVTSVREAEGKTTIVSNLGIALAQTDRRVLIIDADLRRPRLHRLFDICNSAGLVDFLKGASSITDTPTEALATPTNIPGLWIMPSGPGTTNIASLFYLSSAAQLIARVREEFDIVLIDTPPLLAFSDARALGRLSNGVILVARANKTRREELATGHQRLMEDHIPVIGTILNDWQPRDGGLEKYAAAYSRYGL
jgi:succinoglycan biosynthesis transport protein ExoP